MEICFGNANEPITALEAIEDRFLEEMGEDAYIDRINNEVAAVMAQAAICLYALWRVVDLLELPMSSGRVVASGQKCDMARHARAALRSISFAYTMAEAALDNVDSLEDPSEHVLEPAQAEQALREIADKVYWVHRVLRNNPDMVAVARGQTLDEPTALGLAGDLAGVCAFLCAEQPAKQEAAQD